MKKSFQKDFKKQTAEILTFGNLGTGKINVVWDASKASIRGQTISFTANAKKENKIWKLYSELEKILAVHHSSDLLGKMSSLKFQLHEIHNAKADYTLFKLKSSYYEGGEKVGKLLANQLKRTDSNNISVAMMNEREITDTEGIN